MWALTHPPKNIFESYWLVCMWGTLNSGLVLWAQELHYLQGYVDNAKSYTGCSSNLLLLHHQGRGLHQRISNLPQKGSSRSIFPVSSMEKYKTNNETGFPTYSICTSQNKELQLTWKLQSVLGVKFYSIKKVYSSRL